MRLSSTSFTHASTALFGLAVVGYTAARVAGYAAPHLPGHQAAPAPPSVWQVEPQHPGPDPRLRVTRPAHRPTALPAVSSHHTAVTAQRERSASPAALASTRTAASVRSQDAGTWREDRRWGQTAPAWSQPATTEEAEPTRADVVAADPPTDDSSAEAQAELGDASEPADD